MNIESRTKKLWEAAGVLCFLLLLCGCSFYSTICDTKETLQSAPAFGTDYRGNTITYEGNRYIYNENLIHFLFLGVDKKESLEEEHERGGIGQTDAVFLVSLDTKESKLKVFVIPRDSMVPVQRLDREGNYYDTEMMQLSLQYAFGDGRKRSCELTTEAVSELFYQIPISRYCALDLAAVRLINDAVGGVEVKVNDDFTWYTEKFKTGEQIHLKGDVVMEYLQVRNTDQFASSMGRLERQKEYVSALLPTAKHALQKNPYLLYSMLQQLEPYMETDVQKAEIPYIVVQILKSIKNPVEYYTVAGEVVKGELHEEYYTDEQQLYQLIVEQCYVKIP